MFGFKRNFHTLLIIFLFSYSTDILCITNDFEKKLEAIKNNEDKVQALFTTKELSAKYTNSTHEHLAILELQASLYFDLRYFDKALAVGNEIQKIANKNQLSPIEAKSYKMIGIFHYYIGEYHKALEAYGKSLNFYQDLNEFIQQANLHNNIGLVHAAMGDTFKTLESYQLAEAIYKELGNEQDLVDIRHNIAGLYLRLRRFDKAIEMFDEVIEKRIKFGNQSDLASVYSDIGVTYKQSGDLEKALTYLIKALTFYQSVNDLYNLSSTFHNLAEVYNLLNQFEKAKEYATLALEISEIQGYKSVHSGALHSLAKALFALGETDRPRELLKQSTQIAEESGYQQQVRENLSLLPLIYAVLGDRKNAFKVNEQHIALMHKLSNDELNEYLARFESTKLKQQVEQLQQSKRLRLLETKQATQKRSFIYVAIFTLLLIVFLIYRRNRDKKLNQHLEIKVHQRTKELEDVAEQLKHANTVKSQFLANMSHEIRTPLTAIIGESEAIINKDVDESQLIKEVEIIHSNSLYLLELINNILDLSKIESNKLELELQEVDLHLTLHELANMFTEQAKHKGLEFEIVHSLPAPFILKIDVLRVKQIIINLCSNAIKFTLKGRVVVAVSMINNELVVQVSDTGIGLSYSQIQQVFESFTQGDSSISRRFGGSGLGLCLTDQLAKLMHGKIDIESTLNQGSIFTFRLPIELSNHVLDTQQLTKILPDQIDVKQTVFKGKVLLADDHDDNRRLIARFLQSLGLDVVGASDGKQAIEQYFEHKPHVILLDIQMPDMDGIEAFNILRQKGCTVPIIALTANAMSHEVEQYLNLGFTGHLKKPIERKQFISTLDKYLNQDVDVDRAYEEMNNVDMSDLVLQFKSNLELEQQDIILHLTNRDFKLLGDLAHRIAGAAQMFGFVLLSEKAIQLESAIKNGTISKVGELTQSFLNEIDQILW